MHWWSAWKVNMFVHWYKDCDKGQGLDTEIPSFEPWRFFPSASPKRSTPNEREHQRQASPMKRKKGTEGFGFRNERLLWTSRDSDKAPSNERKIHCEKPGLGIVSLPGLKGMPLPPPLRLNYYRWICWLWIFGFSLCLLPLVVKEKVLAEKWNLLFLL